MLILPLIYAGLHFLLRSRSNKAPGVIAHRGAAGLAPENTQAAIRAGILHKADFIEVDVQRSADGVLIVMHDQTVNRTTDGQGSVVNLTWAEISQFDAGRHFGPEYAGETVPRLDSVLEMTQGTSSTLIIEIKEPHLYPGIEPQIAETIQNAQAQDHVTIISFDYESLRKFSALMPSVPLGLVSVYPTTLPQIANHQAVDIFWLSVILDPTLVRRLHHQGYHVWVWTIDNLFIIRLLIWLGVDGITTNRPDLFHTIPGATGSAPKIG
ncbi:MAG: glycerophosphodiester phosphodiesterase [Anaerolineaceae bacterium]|nr:glycerophosphodiester phosphodiesterase [Anaerolineaceae bacterium]